MKVQDQALQIAKMSSALGITVKDLYIVFGGRGGGMGNYTSNHGIRTKNPQTKTPQTKTPRT